MKTNKQIMVVGALALVSIASASARAGVTYMQEQSTRSFAARKAGDLAYREGRELMKAGRHYQRMSERALRAAVKQENSETRFDYQYQNYGHASERVLRMVDDNYVEVVAVRDSQGRLIEVK